MVFGLSFLKLKKDDFRIDDDVLVLLSAALVVGPWGHSLKLILVIMLRYQ